MRSKKTAVAALQITAVVALAVLEMFPAQAEASWRIAALAVLAGCTLYWVQSYRKTFRMQRDAVLNIRRAVNGNTRVRLLAKGEEDWNELIFAVNDLISSLEKLGITAVRSETARKQLLSNLSHDVRTPLTSIIGYIDALKDGVAANDREREEYLDILSAKSAGLKDMVDEMFTMAKLDADELSVQEEELDLAELTRETLIGFLPELTPLEIVPEFLIPEDSCPIRADRNHIQRIIGNLVRNALHYGGEGGLLGVELKRTGPVYRLKVWDKGPGIPVTELERVFDRTYRGERTGNRTQGSGLGLAIVKALAERSGGQVEASSLPWTETAFTVTLPALPKGNEPKEVVSKENAPKENVPKEIVQTEIIHK